MLQTNPDNIVIVDETYIEFAPPGSSCLPLLDRYENLVITHTFSKTHSLAGARLGFCLARPELIADMDRVKFSYSPYNVNSLTQAAGEARHPRRGLFPRRHAKGAGHPRRHRAKTACARLYGAGLGH